MLIIAIVALISFAVYAVRDHKDEISDIIKDEERIVKIAIKEKIKNIFKKIFNK